MTLKELISTLRVKQLILKTAEELQWATMCPTRSKAIPNVIEVLSKPKSKLTDLNLGITVLKFIDCNDFYGYSNRQIKNVIRLFITIKLLRLSGTRSSIIKEFKMYGLDNVNLKKEDKLNLSQLLQAKAI